MAKIDEIQKRLLEEVADLHDVPEGAYNLRANGQTAGRNTTANIDITSKDDGTGIDIHIKPGTKHESVHIPVVLSESGLTEVVYNDFYIGDDADVVIVAGCGISNCGQQDSRHDGIHRFYLGKNSKVKYVEKHYGEGDGNGKRIMNPPFLCGKECQSKICGEALRGGRRQRKAYPESGHGSLHGGKQLHGDGDGPDQGRGFHKPEHEGRAFSRREAGYPGETDDTRRSGGGERICGEFKRG